MALLGRFTVQGHRLGCVFRHTVAVGIHQAKVELRYGITLLSRFAKPADGLGQIFFHAIAGVVHHAQITLRGGVAVDCFRLQGGQGGGVILALVSRFAGLKVGQGQGRAGGQQDGQQE